MKRTVHQERATPLSERKKFRRDARPIEVKCAVCGEVQLLLSSVARVRKTCAKKSCTSELKRRNAGSQAATVEERLAHKVAKRESGCWEWQGATNKDGYGVMMVEGKKMLAHRLSYAMHSGSLSPDALVCHHCDNPPCVNPRHLYAGTNQTNVDDRTSRGRSVHWAGELNKASKLTDGSVAHIRKAWSEGVASQKDLARMFGVSPSLISKVVNGHIWGHVNDEA